MKLVKNMKEKGIYQELLCYESFTTMLFAVIMRFDSLGEIKIVITVEVIKLYHIGVDYSSSLYVVRC